MPMGRGGLTAEDADEDDAAGTGAELSVAARAAARARAVPALKKEAASYRLHQAPMIIPLHAAVKYVAYGLFEVFHMAACFLAMHLAAHNNAP